MERSKQRLEYYTIIDNLYKYAYGITTKGKINNLPFITNINILSNELSMVNEMVSLIKRFGRLSFYADFDQYEVLSKVLITQTLVKDEFRDLFDFVNLSEEIKKYLNTNTNKNDYTLHHELNNKLFNINLVKKIGESYFNHEYELYDSVSPTLKELRHKYKRLNSQVNDTMMKTIKKYDKYLTEKMIVMRNGRNCLPVNISYKNNVNGIIHDYSQSYQTAYIEPIELINIFNELENTKSLILNEEIKIYYEITLKLNGYYNELLNNMNIITQIDFIHAKANYAISIDAVMPKFSDDRQHTLINARHPLLPKETCVPINLIFSNENKVVLLTGANTGGKTVSLKTLGLLTLMLQSGLLIPVSENSKVKLFNNIFVDVGDEQSIVESLSTFSAHLTNLKTMITNLSDDSLILIDELGSGTDPKEGSSIAKAIIDELLNYDLKALITTHYSELKEYGLVKTPAIKLARLKFDLDTLTPMYEIEYDLVGASHAILIAKRLGFKQSIIDNAVNHLEQSKTDIERAQEILVEKEESLILREDEIKRKDKKIKEDEELFIINQSKWEEEKQKYLLNINNEMKKQYEPLKQQANELIDKLKKDLSQKEIAELKGSLNKINESPEIDLTPLKKGDYVYIPKYDQSGYVEKVNKDKYFILLGNFSLSFDRKDLIKEIDPNIKTETTKPKKKDKGSYVETKGVSKTASYEIDLRGIRYIEVKDILDEAVDKAYLANLESIKVIHGYGTGAVRKAVGEYLKSSPYVKNHRSGGEKEGMLGVTIIYLK